MAFISQKTSCSSIVTLRHQWQTLVPELPDPEKTALIDSAADSSFEWKRLYLPLHPLNEQQLEDDRLADRLMDGHRVDPHNPEPGLLINSQPWIDYLSTCPHMISSNREMSSGKGDWVAPYFFERYQLPLGDKLRSLVSTRFRDRSSRFAGHYVALYLGESCPAEKLFVSQGAQQKIEFLQRNGQLVMSLKQPDKGIESYLTFVEESVDNSYFVEICRAFLSK
jgi:hypothetical protein